MDLKNINWKSPKTILVIAAGTPVAVFAVGAFAAGMIQGVRDELASSTASPSPATSISATVTPTQPPTPLVPIFTPKGLLAPQTDRDTAAAILNQSIDHYRHVLAQGQAILGTTQYPDAVAGIAAIEGDPNSPAARFKTWHNPNPETDFSWQAAFKQADAHFNADNEPPSISTWRDDIAQAVTDLGEWTRVADSWQIREKTQADLNAAAAKITEDLGKAAHDAQAVAAGK